jgi:hypothetical protein
VEERETEREREIDKERERERALVTGKQNEKKRSKKSSLI